MEKDPLPGKEDINVRLNRLSTEAQGIIASFSSFFLESDIHDQYLRDKEKIAKFRNQLQTLGLESDAIGLAMELFGFNEHDEGNGKNKVP